MFRTRLYQPFHPVSMNPSSVSQTKKNQAETLVSRGLELIGQNRFFEARSLFSRSIGVAPTAEGYTYLGWMLYHEGLIQEAIDLCLLAIEIDPDFGNPYNDIGSYLMQQEKLDEAIPWLEKAKDAKRYQTKEFPYLNLGRLYLQQGNIDKALSEYHCVLDIDPENEEARMVVEELAETNDEDIEKEISQPVYTKPAKDKKKRLLH